MTLSRLAIPVAALAPFLAAPLVAQDLDFTRDVRPILANYCFACHGPDAAHREGDLRLDQAEGAGDIHGHGLTADPRPRIVGVALGLAHPQGGAAIRILLLRKLRTQSALEARNCRAAGVVGGHRIALPCF